MDNLVKLLGQEEVDKLKELLGENFENFASKFDGSEVIIDQEGEYVKKSDVSSTPAVLEEGWLGEDGAIDMDKVADEALKGYIASLNQKVADGEKKLTEQVLMSAITSEAEKAGAVDVEDLVKFLDLGAVKVKDGVPQGVDGVIASLKESKPYLFKQASTDNGDEGFNPAKKTKTSGYVEGMSFQDAFNSDK